MPYPFTVVEATPRLVEDYGYLYVFTCSRPYKNKNKHFLRMSQVFEKRPIPLSAKNIYVHFSSMKKQGIEPLVSLNRSSRDDDKPVRNEEWAIQNAKAYADQVKARHEEDRLKAEEEESKKEYTSREDADAMIQKQKAEWAEEDKKKNWYQQARTFVRKLIQG